MEETEKYICILYALFDEPLTSSVIILNNNESLVNIRKNNI